MDPRLIRVTDDPINAELPLELQRGVLTPNDLFFWRNRFRLPQVQASDWRVSISGEVDSPVVLSYAALMSMPHRTVLTTLECAGNGRSAMEPPAAGEPWAYGAVGTAEWTGVPLGQLLASCHTRTAAGEVVVEGYDRGHVDDTGAAVPFARSLPMDKAVHEDTIVALYMNGEQLPPEHGYPARLVVPGWYGMASVKWISHIRPIAGTFDGFFQRERYVMAPGHPDSLRPLTAVGVRSLILAPLNGSTVAPGRHTVRGVAWSGTGPVTEVHVSHDGGNRWEPASWTSREELYAWRTWEFSLHVESDGPVALLTRARDAGGHEQPIQAEWNTLGYANNAIQVVTVTVRARR